MINKITGFVMGLIFVGWGIRNFFEVAIVVHGKSLSTAGGLNKILGALLIFVGIYYLWESLKSK